MTSTLKRALQERIDDVDRRARADDSRAETQDIGVIVLAGQARAQRLAANNSPDRLMSICSDRHSYAGSAHQDRTLDFMASNGLTDCVRVIRVVAGGGGVSSKVTH